MSEQLQGRGWRLGRPAKARLPLSHPRGAGRAEKRGRRPGASREVELAAAHSLAGAGGRGERGLHPGCGGSCRAASTPRPRGEAEAEARAEVSKDPSETNRGSSRRAPDQGPSGRQNHGPRGQAGRCGRQHPGKKLKTHGAR